MAFDIKQFKKDFKNIEKMKYQLFHGESLINSSDKLRVIEKHFSILRKKGLIDIYVIKKY